MIGQRLSVSSVKGNSSLMAEFFLSVIKVHLYYAWKKQSEKEKLRYLFSKMIDDLGNFSCFILILTIYFFWVHLGRW